MKYVCRRCKSKHIIWNLWPRSRKGFYICENCLTSFERKRVNGWLINKLLKIVIPISRTTVRTKTKQSKPKTKESKVKLWKNH